LEKKTIIGKTLKIIGKFEWIK